MTRGPDLTPEQNERVKAGIRELLARFGNQVKLAPKLGVHQATLSGILGGRTGASYQLAVNVARLLRVDERQLLGEPDATRPERRLVAADLARDDGVAEAAIQSVLEEAVTPADQHRSTLWWAIRMKRRETEMLDQRPAQPPAAQPGPRRARRKSG